MMSQDTALARRGTPQDRTHPAIAALGSRTRVALTGAASPVVDDLVCDVIAPLLVAFVAWVMVHAREAGIRRLYFVARDGEILFRIAQGLKPVFPNLELCYLHGSRRAWLTPSIHPASRGWERLVIAAGQANSPNDIIGRAGAGLDDQAAIRTALGMSEEEWRGRLGPTDASLFVRRVLDSSAASAAIYGNAAVCREAALAYFRQEGLFDGGSWALVDTGWALNSQAALKRILGIAGGPIPSGYYLGLSRDHLPREDTGPAYSFLAGSGSIFSRRRVVIEHCFTPSTHATTKEYRIVDGVAVPVFGPELRTPGELAYASRLHEAASVMAKIACGEADAVERLMDARLVLLAKAERLICAPTTAEATALACFGTIADLRHERAHVQPLCRALGGRDVWDILRIAMLGPYASATPPMWLEGSCALSPLPARMALGLMLAADRVRHLPATH